MPGVVAAVGKGLSAAVGSPTRLGTAGTLAPEAGAAWVFGAGVVAADVEVLVAGMVDTASGAGLSVGA